jgi:uncharacterized protein (DUF433 family)
MRIDKLLSTEPGGQRVMLKGSLIISASPEIMGGTPVFAGTRVPVQTLLDYLKAGESIDDFLDGFPTVTKRAGHRLTGFPVLATLKEFAPTANDR